MTSAASPSKPSRQQHPHTSQPQSSSQAPVTPASPPARRADLKSWWKKFQVQSTKHHETRGKPASPVFIFIVLLGHITPSYASCLDPLLPHLRTLPLHSPSSPSSRPQCRRVLNATYTRCMRACAEAELDPRLTHDHQRRKRICTPPTPL